MDIAITRQKKDTDILPAESREERDKLDRLKKVKIHRDALSLHGFNMEILKTYPLNGKNVDVPTFLLRDMTKKPTVSASYKFSSESSKKIPEYNFVYNLGEE